MAALGRKERGFTVHAVEATTSELPGETTQFAQALGFSSDQVCRTMPAVMATGCLVRAPSASICRGRTARA